MELLSAKITSMVVLGVGSFLFGILPAWLSPVSRQRCPLFLSCLLCWGAGVLLATSILHMLPEARQTFPDHAEIALCSGFFLIYLVDELVHFLCGDRIDNNNRRRILSSNGRVYERASHGHQDHSHQHRGHAKHSYGANETSSLLAAGGRCEHGDHPREPDACHVNHEEPCMRSKAGFIGLILALLLHSVLEGLAIGLESETGKVLLLLTAVSSHKFVVGFCLGVELSASTRGKIWAHMMAVLIFSVGSVAGIGGGMLLDLPSIKTADSLLGALQALAAGTLLYVTVSEVLPRERAKWHHSKHYAGLVQLLSTVFGFVLMYILSAYCDDH